jgi:hypothetical protein
MSMHLIYKQEEERVWMDGRNMELPEVGSDIKESQMEMSEVLPRFEPSVEFAHGNTSGGSLLGLKVESRGSNIIGTYGSLEEVKEGRWDNIVGCKCVS